MKVSTFILPLLATLVCAIPSQTDDDGDRPVTNTVIDILSNNVEFSTFLRVLQRKGYVPMLNAMLNFTLILPTNSAFVKVDTLPQDFDRYIIPHNLIFLDEFPNDNLKIFETLDDSPVILNWDHDLGSWQFDDAEIVDGNFLATTQNAVVHGIDSMLLTHPTTCEFINDPNVNVPGSVFNNSLDVLPSFDVFKRLLNADAHFCPSNLSNITGFIPLDSALSFNEVELSYLTHSKKGRFDRLQYLNSHLASGYLGGNISVQTTDLMGHNLTIELDPDEHLKVNGQDTYVQDMLTSDGVLHFFDSEIENPVTFNLRKYLYGLNVSDFVQELDFRKLGHLMDDDEIEQTVFINTDDDDDDVSVGSVHKNNDLYQFAKGTIDLDGDMLLDSKYCYGKIGGHCQKIKVTKIGDNQYVLNNHVFIDRSVNYQIGRTKIYLMDDNLSPPPRLDLSIGPYYHASRSMKYLSDLDLIDLHNNKQGYTLFIPENDAWEDLQLTWTYLLHNQTALSILMESIILNGLVYSDFEGSFETTTLDDKPVTLNKTGDDVVLNNFPISIKRHSDVLFSQGVAHTIDKVLIPDHLEITLENLLGSVKSDIFKEFLEFNRLLSLIEDENYSLILPTESSLLRENVTSSYGKINEFLRLHLIPKESLQALLNCESKIPTALNNTDLYCRELTPDVQMLQILEGNDKEVRIMTRGCTSTSNLNKQCVFIVDRPINPDWIDKPFIGIPHIKLPFVAMGIGAIVSLISLIIVLSCCLVVFIGKNASEDDEYDEETDVMSNHEDENTGLVNGSSSQMPENGYGLLGNNNDIGDFSETSYSDNAQSKAINVSNNGNGIDSQKKSFW